MHSTKALVADANLREPEKHALLTSRRRSAIAIQHREFGSITINDNRPLAMESLATCLDDGLTPEDWLNLLNARVFFFTHPVRLDSLRNATATRTTDKIVLAFDTLRLARHYADAIEVAPFNTGNTMRRPALRGLDTFARLPETDYAQWRRRRGNKSPDKIQEVVTRGSVLNVPTYLATAVQDGAAP